LFRVLIRLFARNQTPERRHLCCVVVFLGAPDLVSAIGHDLAVGAGQHMARPPMTHVCVDLRARNAAVELEELDDGPALGDSYDIAEKCSEGLRAFKGKRSSVDGTSIAPIRTIVRIEAEHPVDVAFAPSIVHGFEHATRPVFVKVYQRAIPRLLPRHRSPQPSVERRLHLST
jgi:hypothetical protein